MRKWQEILRKKIPSKKKTYLCKNIACSYFRFQLNAKIRSKRKLNAKKKISKQYKSLL